MTLLISGISLIISGWALIRFSAKLEMLEYQVDRLEEMVYASYGRGGKRK